MRKAFILCETASLGHEFMRDLRDTVIQRDRLRFRRNIERMGELIAYEISKDLNYSAAEVKSSLGLKKTQLLDEYPVICSVLRAGLPFQQGILNYFDRSDAAFVSAFRKHISDTEFQIEVQYLATPNLKDRVLILADPMMATGQSLVLTHEALLKNGAPKRLIIASLIASKEGLAYVQQHLPQAEIYIGDLDDELNEHAYIIPGLGDAGDLSFGVKLWFYSPLFFSDFCAVYSHIRYLFFDLDHTLWDFETNSNETLLELFEEHNLAQHGLFDFQQFILVYKGVNHGLWDQYNRGQVSKERLRERRFKETFEQLGLDQRYHPAEFSDQYIFRCTEKPAVFPEAHRVLDELKKKFGMSIITNGFPESQSRKMTASRLDGYFDHIVISEEVGFAKPHPGIFQSALDRSNMPAEAVLMIGDNLHADVEGAQKAGIEALWFNPEKKDTPSGVKGIHELKQILELPGLL